MTKKVSPFKEFLSYFPPIQLPITLSSDLHLVFSKENKPLPQALTFEFLQQGEEGEDEFTEYVPCFSLKVGEQFVPVVFWKAGLMSYEYILATFQRNGSFISSKVIAGTKSDGESMLKRIATIDEEALITVAEGTSPLDESQYEANQSQTFQFEIAETGDILQMIIEN